MKHSIRQMLCLLLVAAMLCVWLVPASAADTTGNWWEEYVGNSDEAGEWEFPGIDENGIVHPEGNYILFTSDLHRYTYLAKPLLETANAMIAADGEEGNVGLCCFGGDFANEYNLYNDNMTILSHALKDYSPGTVATFTKGNHEGYESDEEFKYDTGMSRIGEVAISESGAYHMYNFGAMDKNQTFQLDDINALAEYLAGLEDNKPVFIVSHYPLHYYNSRRVSKNAAALIEILNNYPQVVFLWGHNHTESDPAYGYVRRAGDFIQTGAGVDTTVEINFTYANLGALRDGINGANGVLAKVDGNDVEFRYINLHNTTNGDTWTDAQGNENTIRYPGEVDAETNMLSDNVIVTDAPLTDITLTNIKIDRPLVDKAPATTAFNVSERYTAGEVTWTANGEPAGATFDFDTVYTATVTLTAAEGYQFTQDAVVSVNKVYVGPMDGQQNNEADVTVSDDGKTAVVSFTFDATTAQGAEALDVATEIVEGNQYMVAAIEDNYTATYLYNPADHGEESKAEYSPAASDIVIRDGKLVSLVDPSMTFTAQADDTGYLLWSDASLNAMQAGEFAADGPLPSTTNTLNVSCRGGEFSIEAAETVDASYACNWNLDENGLPYVDYDGTILYAAYSSGFVFVTDPAECNVRLYDVGTNEAGLLYNVSVNVNTPVAGETASNELVSASAGAEVESISWDAESFDYDGSYTVTATVKAAEGYTVAEDYLTARVNGNAADVSYADGVITVSYTFATKAAPGQKLALKATETDTLEDGDKYVIVSNGYAMVASRDGVYGAGTAVTVENGQITSPITSDMVFTLEGNETDGFTVNTEAGYMIGATEGDKPDVWGLMFKDSVGCTIALQDGKLAVIATGISAGMGPAQTSTNYFYENNGHFNYALSQLDDFTVYKLDIPFTDVTAGKYYASPVAWAAFNGIANGKSSTTFEPHAKATRAEALTMLWRAEGCPEPTITVDDIAFTDVKAGKYYTKAVLWAYENSITKGVSATEFGVKKEVSRAMMVTFLYRAAGEPEVEGTVDFTDVKTGKYYTDAVIWATQQGITKGTSSTIFGVKDGCERGMIVTFLYRAYGV